MQVTEYIYIYICKLLSKIVYILQFILFSFRGVHFSIIYFFTSYLSSKVKTEMTEVIK